MLTTVILQLDTQKDNTAIMTTTTKTTKKASCLKMWHHKHINKLDKNTDACNCMDLDFRVFRLVWT